MSYTNRNKNQNQQFHHRGALTKLNSSTSSSVGTFHTLNGSSTGNGRAGLGNRSIGAGLSVARNVPKLVNTSSLRKENGGQDITAVLVNRNGEFFIFVQIHCLFFLDLLCARYCMV